MSVIQLSGYILALILALVPTPLLEFRYFILPFFIARLWIHPTSRVALLLEGLIYVIVNVVTFYLFLMKPFEWSSEPGKLQRFMW